jgi:RimJ/RimL family protein N-acetyltransferase
MPDLETPRLVGRPLTPDDHPFLTSLWNDPEVAAWLGGIKTPAQVAARLAALQPSWERHGFGLWIFRTLADGEPVGYAGLGPTDVGGAGGVEVLYAVASTAWGRGYGTEMAEAVVAEAFGPLGLDELVCFTMTTNVGSQRVMANAGFVYERDLMHAGLPHRFSRLRRT